MNDATEPANDGPSMLRDCYTAFWAAEQIRQATSAAIARSMPPTKAEWLARLEAMCDEHKGVFLS
jgi:hypothetical protein